MKPEKYFSNFEEHNIKEVKNFWMKYKEKRNMIIYRIQYSLQSFLGSVQGQYLTVFLGLQLNFPNFNLLPWVYVGYSIYSRICKYYWTNKGWWPRRLSRVKKKKHFIKRKRSLKKNS